MSQQNECRTWVEVTCKTLKTNETHYVKYESNQIPKAVFRELKSEESYKKMCKNSSGKEKPSGKNFIFENPVILYLKFCLF